MIHQIFLFHVAFSPLEPNFRKVAENFDNFFKGVMKKGGLNDIATNGGRRVVFNPKRGKLPITKYLQICTEKCTSNGNYYYNFECDRDDKMNVKANSWVLRWHCHLRLIVLRESEGKKSFGRSIDSVTVPLVEISRDSVVKTALAGGISCSFSTLLMHPIDTVKRLGLDVIKTTPFDVIKTRMMTAIQGQPTAMSVVALCILRLGLFRGALPRFFWVGAINFAGYELIRSAMD